jgi:nuclear transport factor 2 (NTF2) superfamily protein
MKDMLKEYTDKIISDYIEEQEKIIKETVDQGFEYLLISKETSFIDNIATIQFKYKGIDDINKGTIEMFRDYGIEVFELDKVRKHLEQQNN